ncbi:hypothetical protein BVX95_00315 [archaeon D22]|nr:hypothetical protein BVX95_00315 [archaeon D22]
MLILLPASVLAASITTTLGSYDSEMYSQSTINIPVTVKATNVTGVIEVTLTDKSGLACDTCTYSPTFTGGTNEQQLVTFTLTGTKTGTYNPPFVSITASSGSTQATPITSGNQVVVVEKPTWSKDFSADTSSLLISGEAELELVVTPTGGSFEDVEIELNLPSGITLVSGSDSINVGTLTGEATYRWNVKATSAGTKEIEVVVTSSNPKESASLNKESVTITVTDPNADEDEDTDTPSGGGGAGGGLGSTPIVETESFDVITDSAVMEVTNDKIAVSEIEISVSEEVVNGTLSIEKKTLSDEYPEVDGELYQSFEIDGDNIQAAFLDGSLKFKVENAWIDEQNISDSRVFLSRYNGNNWVQEHVIKLHSDEEFTYYKASIKNLGMFSISTLKEAVLDYIKMSSLKPELIDAQMVIESGLSDSLMISKIEEYLFKKIDVEKTVEQSVQLVKHLELKREVKSQTNSSVMTITIKNNKDEKVSFLFVEAVPKSIVHDIYELYNFNPRIYDMIVREDPIIQWSFGQADTAIVLWEIKDLMPGDEAWFEYSLDAVFEVEKYPAPIIVKPFIASGFAEASEEVSELDIDDKRVKKTKVMSILVSMLTLLAIVGALVSFKLSKPKSGNDDASETKESDAGNDKAAPLKTEAHATQHLKNYVSKLRNSGVDDEKIRHNLKKVGWSESKIDEILK